jgi:hypothetical protein
MEKQSFFRASALPEAHGENRRWHKAHPTGANSNSDGPARLNKGLALDFQP